jgi:hypothetical protein
VTEVQGYEELKGLLAKHVEYPIDDLPETSEEEVIRS